MAPNLARKGNQAAVQAPGAAKHIETTRHPEPASAAVMAAPQGIARGAGSIALTPEVAAMVQAMAAMQAEALKASCWVGENFADDARAMHYGEKDQALIHGRATAQEARDLLEEGIEIAPILFPLAPPGHVN